MSDSGTAEKPDPSVERWLPPSIAERSFEKLSNTPGHEIEDIHRQAFEHGLSEGRATGLDEIQQEMQQKVETLDEIIQLLDQPLKNLDNEMESGLVELALAVAKQVIRREIKTDPGQIAAVIREAIGSLPASSQKIRIHLHPEDSAWVREHLLNQDDHHWQVHDDPTLKRGDCKLITETAHVDATVEARVSTIAAKILGGERSDDSASAS